MKSETVDIEVSTSLKNRIPTLLEFFKLTKDDEVIILAYIINNSLLDQETSTEMILTNCYNKKISEWPKIIRITSLLQKKCLITEKAGSRTKKTISNKFYAEQATLNAVIKGDNSILKKDVIVSFDDFVEAIKKLFNKRRTQTIEYADLEKEMHKIFSKYKKQLGELRWIESLKLTSADTILLFAFIIHKVEDDGDYHYEKAVKQLFMTKERMSINRGLSNSSHALFTKGVINRETDEVYESIRLSEYALEKIFPENRDLINYKPKLGKIVHYSQIKAEDLFYNPAEKTQIETIRNGLSNDNYNQIVNKLKKYDVPSQSFNALFYGSPGCGKTSSVYQIARATNRNVYFVEVTSILSKYVGETEKLISQLFRDYIEWNRSQENKGILLINEIDTIFSKRVHVNGSNDQFSNQIVTTFLQEIELCTDGIVMATTNCTDLDPALDRRFLFKVRFEQPIEEVSSQILENKLNIEGIRIDTKVLKNKQLTGAQIQNLKQKIIIKNITEGTTIFSDQLQELVEEELSLSRHQTRTVIGFK